MTVEFKEIEAASDILYEAVGKIPEQIKRLYKEISLCDQEVNDLLHLIEFESFNASEGYRHSRDLQITLLQRRKFKDEIDSLRSFQDRMGVSRTMDDQAVALHNLVQERTKALKKKSYHPRVRKDLTGRFQECKKKKKLKLEGE